MKRNVERGRIVSKRERRIQQKKTMTARRVKSAATKRQLDLM